MPHVKAAYRDVLSTGGDTLRLMQRWPSLVSGLPRSLLLRPTGLSTPNPEVEHGCF
jgi:hypothetical protein